MDNELFKITEWNKNVDGRTHEKRFMDWLNNISEIQFQENKIVQNDSNVNFSNIFRVSKIPGSIKIKQDNFDGKDGAGSLFCSLLANWENDNIDDEDLGAKYLGTSLVFFPCYNQVITQEGRKKIYENKLNASGVIVAMGMGTGGPGPDEKLVSNPGHIRRFEGIVNVISKYINPEETILWFREEPLLHKPVPDLFIKKTKELFEAEPYALQFRGDSNGGYGQYLYAVTSLKFDTSGNLSKGQKKIIKTFIQFYSRERGLKTGDKDPAYNWYNVLFGNEDINIIKEKLERNKFLILAGPPGSGKTNYINEIALEDYKDRNTFIQFHPNTTYHSFVGGIQPILNGDAKFNFYKGPLITAIEEANKCPDKKYLLVIDEINRADISSVLGEAINLFEPTQKYEVDIPNYDNKRLQMPDNLYVLCAMNTADRNISSIDVAIRRRFAFTYIWPKEPEGRKSCPTGCEYFNKMRNIFLEYGNKQDLNLMPGGFYFLGDNENSFKNTIKDRLLPLLEDYLNENRLSSSLLQEIDLFIQVLKQNLNGNF